MNRIEQKFKELRKKGKKALIAFITAGDPNLETTKRLVIELERSGVDILELGMPFSDPLADGPTIQRASVRALENKISLRATLRLIADLRRKVKLPIAVLTYYNPVFRYGAKNFVRDAKSSGLDGIIVPDLPPEEGSHIIEYAKTNEFATILLVAPTSQLRRIKLISSLASGFIYYVSLTGVTGARKKLPGQISQGVKLVKSFTHKPVCVGFGISKPQQVAGVLKVADGVIVGSAIIDIIEKNLNRKDLVEKVGKFARQLKSAIR